MEDTELRTADGAGSSGRHARFEDELPPKATPRSSQSSGTAAMRLTDSAKHLSPGTYRVRVKPSPSEPQSREPSATTGHGETSLNGRDSGGIFGVTSRSHCSESALRSIHSSFDPSRLMSVVVQPSEAGNRSQLNTQASFLDGEPEVYNGDLQTADTLPDQLDHRTALLNSSRELAPGIAISSWKRRDSSLDARKRLLDDSALEADSPADPETLEKLWPLMAAVQRRQTAGSSPRKPPNSLKLNSEHTIPAGDRSPKLTRAQAEFLAAHSRGPAGYRAASPKQPGFFHRHSHSSPALRSSPRDRYDSLRLLDTRKERRIDPQERVRLWLEQNEHYLLSSQSPGKGGSTPPTMRSKQAAPAQAQEQAKGMRQKPLQRLFSCFAI